MTKQPTPPDEVDALLANGRLGGPARERILSRVLDAVDVEPRRAPLRRALLGLIPVSAVCAVAAFIFLAPGRHPSPAGTGRELRAKGAPSLPTIDPLCDGEVGVCTRGQRLYFRADASPAPRWLVAYAEAVDVAAPAGRLWMFPEENQVAPPIPIATQPSILRRAVELGGDLRPGRYRLTMIVFDHAVGRAEASDPSARGIRIVRSLVIK